MSGGMRYGPDENGVIRGVPFGGGGSYVGEFKKFGFASVPEHCLACDGSAVSREAYKELFQVFGETYGAGDGETTFNLPDFRGAFLRSVGGNAAELGVEQGDAIRPISGHFDVRVANNSTSIVLGDNSLYKESVSSAPFAGNTYAEGILNTSCNRITFDVPSVVPTAVENRPINYAVNVCVVYEI